MRCKLLLFFIFFILYTSSKKLEAQKPTHLSLEQAISIAKKKSEQFQIAREELKQALIARQKAWASFMPVISIQGTFTHADKEISFNNRMIQKQDSFSSSASASITIFKPSSIAGLLQSYSSSAASVESSKWTSNELSFEIASAYCAVISAINLIKAAENSVEIAKEHLNAVSARIEAGEALEIDRTRAQMELVTAQSELVNAINAKENAEDYLGLLIGINPPFELEPLPEITPSILHHTSNQPSEALKKRADFYASMYNIKAAKKGVQSSWSGFLPNLEVTASYRATENTGFANDPFSWNIMVNLEWIIWDGGYLLASGLENKSKLNQAKLKHKQLEKQIKIEVKEAIRNMENSKANLEVSIKKLELASQTRDMVLSRYNAGLATSLELAEADETLRQAKIQQVMKELEYSLSKLELLKVTGYDPTGKEVSEL